QEHERRSERDQARFPLEQFDPPLPKETGTRSILPAARPAVITRRSERAARPSVAETGLGEGPTGPGEALLVPAGERRERDALARRVDEPAAAGVDAHVVDLRRLRARPARAEEDDVARLDARERDPLGRRHLAAHRIGRPAAERLRERRRAGVRLELVHAPHETRTVEAAARHDAERAL